MVIEGHQFFCFELKLASKGLKILIRVLLRDNYFYFFSCAVSDSSMLTMILYSIASFLGGKLIYAWLF